MWLKLRSRRLLLSCLSFCLIVGTSFSSSVFLSADEAKQNASSFQLLENFDSFLAGNINNQGEWRANGAGLTAGAIVDGDPPDIFDRKVLRNNPNNTLNRGNAYLSLGGNQLAASGISTLAFQLSLDNPSQSNFSIGLSDKAEPDIFTPNGIDDFVVEVNFSNQGLRLRSGNGYLSAANVTLQANLLYQIWLVVDSSANSYQLYVAEPSSPFPLLVQTNSVSTFNFRGTSNEVLKTFILQNVGTNSSDSYLDQLYIDNSRENLSKPAKYFQQLDNFQGLTIGSISGQNGWGFQGSVTVGEEAPNSNRYITFDGPGASVYKEMALGNNESTLHFRIRRQGLVNGAVGTSADDAPRAWTLFEARFGADPATPDSFFALDGDTANAVGSGFEASRWYCTWLVVNNSSGTYEAYVKGGDYATVAQLNAAGQETFALPGNGADIVSFFARTGSSTTGQLELDDIYFDPDNRNLTTPGAECGVESSSGGVLNPVPTPVVSNGTVVQFEEIVTLPQTAVGTIEPGQNPRSRVNFLYHSRDGSDRLFANDLRGPLYLIKPDQGSVSEYLNIKSHFSTWWLDAPGRNSGFSSFAFHPDFANNGLLYTIHTELANGTPDYATSTTPVKDVHGVLVEWRANNPQADSFAGSKRELLRVGQASILHGMQLVQFNPLVGPGDPDYGMLYLSNGDGESPPAFSGEAQNRKSIQGTIIRIDPDGNNSPNGKYGIPSDNPFVGDLNALGELYAYGFRNPIRFAWDPGSGKMIESDVGQHNLEEINLIQPGKNYGWNEREGTFVFDRNNPEVVQNLPSNDNTLGYTYPVAQFDHDEGYAIIGGFPYRGQLMPEMVGKYIFGSMVLGKLFYVNIGELTQGQQAQVHLLVLKNPSGQEVDFRQLVDPQNQRADLRFGLDEDGEIYLLSKQDGVVRRLRSANGSPPSTATPASTAIPTSGPTTVPPATVPPTASTPRPTNPPPTPNATSGPGATATDQQTAPAQGTTTPDSTATSVGGEPTTVVPATPTPGGSIATPSQGATPSSTEPTKTPGIASPQPTVSSTITPGGTPVDGTSTPAFVPTGQAGRTNTPIPPPGSPMGSSPTSTPIGGIPDIDQPPGATQDEKTWLPVIPNESP